MPKTAFGKIGSWVRGKIRESNKCGALFGDFYRCRGVYLDEA